MKKKYLICFIIVIVGVIFFFQSSHHLSLERVVYRSNQFTVLVDGKEVDMLPVSGSYYLSSYRCDSKNTVLAWDKDSYQLRVSNGNKKGGVACYLNFESTPKLADMKAGSFVKYVGNNGCEGGKCSGENANYVDSEHKGYCLDSSSQFVYDGYRIAYTKDNSAYLISAGAMDCVCTNSDGTYSSSCSSYVSVDNLPLHVSNLNRIALKYCNVNYVDGGVCNTDSVRNINSSDFDMMSRLGLFVQTCDGIQTKKCGYANDLIDIGSYYWYSVSYDSLSHQLLFWNSHLREISHNISSSSYGVRPVIKMSPDVIVVGGSGSYDDPYKIASQSVVIDNINKGQGILNLRMIGYEVDKMCVNLNSSVCTNYISFSENYRLDIGLANSGENTIYVYYQNSSGDIVASIRRTFNLE